MGVLLGCAEPTPGGSPSLGGSGGQGGSGAAVSFGGAALVSRGGSGAAGAAAVDGGSVGMSTPVQVAPAELGDPWRFEAPRDVAIFRADGAVRSWSEPGLLRLDLSLAAGQSAQLHYTAPGSESQYLRQVLVDMTGRRLVARLRFEPDGAAEPGDSGTPLRDAGISLAGGAQLFAQTEGWTWTPGDTLDLIDADQFVLLGLDLSQTPDESRVIKFGIQLFASEATRGVLWVEGVWTEPR